LYLSVAGHICPSRGRGVALGHELTITDIGVHVMDSYDFEGEQPLGYWSDYSVSRGPSKDPSEFLEVTNKTFRDWRSQNGKGGDFLVFSDVKRIKLLHPKPFFVFW
jgi:hypothetical protein